VHCTCPAALSLIQRPCTSWAEFLIHSAFLSQSAGTYYTYYFTPRACSCGRNGVLQVETAGYGTCDRSFDMHDDGPL
jgi:hypothetical protein